ncbi:hypothetical protein L202_07506 [Cryptococcus amylolentus CBS 6039]|uniref:Uncharacterized protein n=2 Tax=Cryptococcus amylolentus TaxID=104669 RepID=A0A1E3HF20_9TREE|nr:hypothetical protein L202_07506 [Cryptococcus amylolentus CBS 6039]ODN74031.1 hypothetical protein L202_07506 [Cryptococcus amylolentus CBS 6039]ODO00169.1 hypothetical protein I350_06794 [Cryptococcus amylolentus CBS 6273]
MSSTAAFSSVVHMSGYFSSLTALTSHWLPPLTTTTCFNIATAAMVLNAIALREMYLEANSLFWVSTLAEADVAFVRTEIFRNLYILSSVIITTLDISRTFKQNHPYSASCWVIIRFAIVCACYSRIALSTKFRNQFPQGPERQTVPLRDDKISMDRVQREREYGMKEPVGF